VRVSRFKVIQKLVKMKYKSKRPTAIQIQEIIMENDLSLYKSDGKKRNREVVGKAVAKAFEKTK
tara:strand:- start:326 stop:517 length:192 start_codon:yes stop_codon:yes gene_type:complete